TGRFIVDNRITVAAKNAVGHAGRGAGRSCRRAEAVHAGCLHRNSLADPSARFFAIESMDLSRGNQSSIRLALKRGQHRRRQHQRGGGGGRNASGKARKENTRRSSIKSAV